jgi:FPC/CPF motif-containing protein YcgG
MERERRVPVTQNPFDGPDALRWSNYCRPEGDGLCQADSSAGPSALTSYVHEHLLAHMRNRHFTCLGAKSAIRQRSYRFGLYPTLGADVSTAGLARDLFAFVQEAPHIDGRFSTYIASFQGPAIANERSFERLLWGTLQALHEADAPHHGWDRTVSADVNDPRFSFSFAGTAFFIVGLHPASSRVTRRTAWPTLVFNPHRQFETLKATGQFDRFRNLIRSAERRLQGEVNPMVGDFGERSEAAQYSGRAVDADWRCPFHTRVGAPPEEE